MATPQPVGRALPLAMWLGVSRDGDIHVYRAGRFSELHAFMGDALVFDRGVPKVFDPLPLLEQVIAPGARISRQGNTFHVEPCSA